MKKISILVALVACAAAGIGHIDTKDARAFCYKAGERDVSRVVDLKSRTAQGRIHELLRALHPVKTTRSR